MILTRAQTAHILLMTYSEPPQRRDCRGTGHDKTGGRSRRGWGCRRACADFGIVYKDPPPTTQKFSFLWLPVLRLQWGPTQDKQWHYASSVVVARTAPYGFDIFEEDAAAGIIFALDSMTTSMADPSRAAKEE